MRKLCKLAFLSFLCGYPMLAVSVDMDLETLAKQKEINQHSFLSYSKYKYSEVENKSGIRNYKFINDSKNEFRVFYPAGSYDPGSMKRKSLPIGGMNFKWIPQEISNSRCALIQYSVRFPENFDFVKGGKLPGLFGGIGNTGGKVPNGFDGFSVRLLWRKNGLGSVYAYLPSSHKWGERIGKNEWSFRRGIWERITLLVSLNDVGINNGVIKVWLNDKKVIEVDDLLFRASSNLKINGVLFSTFYGGNNASFAPVLDQYIDFSNIVVSKAISSEMRCL